MIQHAFVQANGLRFHVAQCGEGHRLALLLHGFPERWISWRYQMPLLARLGYRVWAPDLRGYGETERPRGVESYAIETLMEDVAGLIDVIDVVAGAAGHLVRAAEAVQRLAAGFVDEDVVGHGFLHRLRSRACRSHAMFALRKGFSQRLQSLHADHSVTRRPAA